jgi:hypothetical protein
MSANAAATCGRLARVLSVRLAGITPTPLFVVHHCARGEREIRGGWVLFVLPSGDQLFCIGVLYSIIFYNVSCGLFFIFFL